MQTILSRYDLPLVSQKEIGYALGLRVPPEASALFPGAEIETNASGECGTQVQNQETGLNRFFQNYDLPFREHYHLPSDSEDLRGTLSRSLSLGFDLIVCFHEDTVNANGKECAHAAVVEELGEGEVILIDPAPDVPPRHSTSYELLFEAMHRAGTHRRGGVWTLELLSTED